MIRHIQKTFIAVTLILSFSVCEAMAYEWAGTNDRFEIAPGLTVGGSVRARYELKNDFKFSKTAAGTDDARTLIQFRFNTEWQPNDWFSLFVEGQDARVHGENAVTNENAVPSPGFVSDPWDLHQAYIEIKSNKEGMFKKVKVGRQKLNFGSQRLIGALEWVNTARVWDAVKVVLGNEQKSLVLFAAQQVLVDPNNPNDWADLKTARYQDSDLYGLYFTGLDILKEGLLEVYWLYRDNGDTPALGVASSGGDEVHSFGTRFEKKVDKFDFNGEFVTQFGDFGGLDHQAFAAHIEAGMKVESLNQSRVSIAYNYASGDDDSSDDDYNTFDNLYPTNHKFYGYMDFLAWQNMHNVETAIKFKLFENKVPVRVAAHWFWLDNEDTDSLYGAARSAFRSSGGSDVSSYVGKEIDITATYWIVPKRVNVLVGYSHFFAGDYLGETGSKEDADFFYLQSKLTF